MSNKGGLFRSVLLVGLAIYLTACGFHLRGQVDLPSELVSIHLQIDTLDSRQRAELRRKLQKAGASLQEADQPQQVRLEVSIGPIEKRNVVDAAGVGITIVRISRQLNYKLSAASDDQTIKSGTLQRQLDIELDDNNLLDIDDRIRRGGESLDGDLIDQLVFLLAQE